MVIRSNRMKYFDTHRRVSNFANISKANPGVLGAVVGLVFVSIGIILRYPSFGILGGDQGFFLYSGIMSSNGYIVYLNLFDVKPPGMHILMWFIGELSLGQPLVLYSISTTIAILLTILVFALSEVYVRLVTESFKSGVITVITLASFSFWQFPILGVYVKLITSVLALLILIFMYEQKFVTAGILAALSASVWQLTAPVFFIVVLVAIIYRKWKATLLIIGSGGLLSIIFILPFYLVGAETAMFSQVVWPLFHNSPTLTPFTRFFTIFTILEEKAFISIFAVLGYIVRMDYIRRGYEVEKELFATIVFGCFYLIGATTGNVNGHDFVQFVPFLAIGVGFLIGTPVEKERILPNISPPTSLAIILIFVAILLTVPPIGDTPPRPTDGEFNEKYYNIEPPETCISAWPTGYAESYVQNIPTDSENGRCWDPTYRQLFSWLKHN